MAPTVKHGQGTETKSVVLRKLGINETYQLAMYLLDQYRGTTLSCRYDIPPQLAESQAQLENAVKVAVVDIIMRHPMLQVSMINASSKSPSWIQLESLDLTQHIKWVDLMGHGFENMVKETFSTQLDERFPDLSILQPGWKITIIRQGDTPRPSMEVLLTWNHPWFDAMGAKVFHEDLIKTLNNHNGAHEQTTAGLDGNILKLPEQAPLLPTPIEVLTDLPVGVKVLAKALWEDVRPQFLNRDITWATWCPIRPSPYRTQYRAFWVDQASVSAILALCRQNTTTITGLINGLALIAFSLRLDTAAAPGFQSSTIVDHRRNLPPAASEDAPWVRSDRAVSNYVTQCLHRWDTDLATRIRSKLPTSTSKAGGVDLSAELQSELWAASAQNRLEIAQKLETGLQNDLVGLFKYVTDWQQTMGAMAKKKRQFAWLVTNIGVLDPSLSTASNGGGGDSSGSKPDDREEWSISRAQFGLSTEVPSAAIAFSPVSVADRGMSVGASWADCAVEATLGDRIMADLERWLAQLATQS